jgi:hypothetical protein
LDGVVVENKTASSRAAFNVCTGEVARDDGREGDPRRLPLFELLLRGVGEYGVYMHSSNRFGCVPFVSLSDEKKSVNSSILYDLKSASQITLAGRTLQ